MNQITPGSIWASDEAEYLVVNFCKEGSYAAVLRLMEEDRGHRLKVRSRDIRYTDPMKLQYAFTYRLQDFVRQLSDEEFGQVKLAIADALGLNITYGQQDATEALKESPGTASGAFEQISMQEAVERSTNEFECVYIAKKLEPDEPISELINAEMFLLERSGGQGR